MVKFREVIVIVLVLEYVVGKTITWPFNIPNWKISSSSSNSIEKFQFLNFKQTSIQIKVYTGRRIAEDSLITAYVCEDTLAVVEKDNEAILNCEITEVM